MKLGVNLKGILIFICAIAALIAWPWPGAVPERLASMLWGYSDLARLYPPPVPALPVECRVTGSA